MSKVTNILERETQDTWQNRNVCRKLSLEPPRAFSLSEVITEEGALEVGGGCSRDVSPAALAGAIRAAAWEGEAGSSCSSDGALKGTGVPPKRQMERFPGGWWSLTLRWAGAERPPERPKEPRAGGDGETGGRQEGSDTPRSRADLSRNWRWLRNTRASCEPGGAAPPRAPEAVAAGQAAR